MSSCPLCGSSHTVELPSPSRSQSITTAGVVLREPLAKRDCLGCGVVFRRPLDTIDKVQLYLEGYESYFARPGAQTWDRPRYAAMAEWILSVLGTWRPTSVLDVGCGAGWMLAALGSHLPPAKLVGVEPSPANAAVARDRGFEVTQGFLPDVRPTKGPFDLILSTNVMQHVEDPKAFLRAQAEQMSEDGRLVVICPDGSIAGNELLWVDHGFSFRAGHLQWLAAAAGLTVVAQDVRLDGGPLQDKQILVLKRSPEPVVAKSPAADRRLHGDRVRYLNDWSRLARYLADHAVRAPGTVLNFGASMWSMLLAGHAPRYWECVESCMVDGADGAFLGKPVQPTGALEPRGNWTIVLGVAPYSQRKLKRRLSSWPCRVVTWADVVSR